MATASKSLSSDSTSLVDLKAEVFRKKEEALYNKANSRTQAKANDPLKKNKNNIWSKTNVGILKRNSEDLEKSRKEQMRIQMALEQKAEVYDKLKSGKYKDKDNVFLVNFDDDEAEEEIEQDYGDEDEWVDYTDALGRTRKCHKSDLIEMKKRDVEQFGEEGITSKTEAEQTLLSEDMRRDFLRQKWEKEEEENMRKTQLHYKDVLFDEARTHGASFYNFSRNESDRLSQMENLESLHNETVEARAKKDAKKSNLDAKMAARLKKVRDKKRLKMGLPLLPDNDDLVKTSSGENISDKVQNEPNDQSIEASVLDGLRDLRKKEEENRMRNSIVREWDIGKEGVNATKPTDQDEFKEKLKINTRLIEKKVLSQQEWNDKKRSERAQEFAPPQNYEGKSAASQKKKLTNQPGKKSYSNVPPPQSPSTSTQFYKNVPPPEKTRQTDMYPNMPPPRHPNVPTHQNPSTSRQFYQNEPPPEKTRQTGGFQNMHTPPPRPPPWNQDEVDSFGFYVGTHPPPNHPANRFSQQGKYFLVYLYYF